MIVAVIGRIPTVADRTGVDRRPLRQDRMGLRESIAVLSKATGTFPIISVQFDECRTGVERPSR